MLNFTAILFLIFYLLNYLPELKVIYAPLLKYYRILYLSIYKSLPEGFILSNAFVLLPNNPLVSTWRMPFFTFCEASIVVIKFLCFYLKSSLFFLFLNDSSAWYNILGSKFFFQKFGYIIPLPFGLQVCAKKSTNWLWELPSMGQVIFSLLLQNFLIFDNVIMSWCRLNSSYLGYFEFHESGCLYSSPNLASFGHDFF